MPARIASGTGPRNSMVRYEIQRRESSVHPSPSGTIASVGHASMQRVQEPHRSGGGAPLSNASEVMISPRQNHDPCGSLIKQVLRPIHPSPASRAKLRSSRGAVSTQILYSNG